MSNKAYAVCGMMRQLTDENIAGMSTAALNHLATAAQHLAHAAESELNRRFGDAAEAEHRRARAARDVPIQAHADTNGREPSKGPRKVSTMIY